MEESKQEVSFINLCTCYAF